MRLATFTAVALAGAALASCDRIPGTPKAKARAAITSAMFDAGAAKFKYLDAPRAPQAVCGYVNGKNRMGAYVGFTPFLYDAKTGAAAVYEGPPTDLDLRINLQDRAGGDDQVNDYVALSNRCEFVTSWREKCGDPAATGVATNDKLCGLMKGKPGPLLDYLGL